MKRDIKYRLNKNKVVETSVNQIENISYTLIRSDRKTVSIQVKQDLSITVRAPKRVKQKDIEKIILKRKSWIQHSADKIREDNKRRQSNIKKLSENQLKELVEEAKQYIPKQVEYYATLINVTYGRVTIRNQKTRWGSCSSKGNINFNCLLMLAPEYVIDYVIVHELCHRKEMNHSKAFWDEVSKYMPDYKQAEAWLKKEGSYIINYQLVKASDEE